MALKYNVTLECRDVQSQHTCASLYCTHLKQVPPLSTKCVLKYYKNCSSALLRVQNTDLALESPGNVLVPYAEVHSECVPQNNCFGIIVQTYIILGRWF